MGDRGGPGWPAAWHGTVIRGKGAALVSHCAHVERMSRLGLACRGHRRERIPVWPARAGIVLALRTSCFRTRGVMQNPPSRSRPNHVGNGNAAGEVSEGEVGEASPPTLGSSPGGTHGGWAGWSSATKEARPIGIAIGALGYEVSGIRPKRCWSLPAGLNSAHWQCH